jgi:PDZ domain-containing protein/aspartyl protease
MLRRGFCEVRPLARPLMKNRFIRAAVASQVIACLGWVPDALTFSVRASVPEHSQCAGKVGCKVSFEVIDNRIFVPVWLNGQGPFHILFDTGAGASVSMEVAEKLKLPREGQTEGSGVGDATVRGYQSHLKAVAIGRVSGGATAENIEVQVIPFTDSPAVFGTIPVDGYLGFPFYEKYVVEHDYRGKTLTFRDSQTFAYAGHGSSLEVESTDYVPVVNGTLDGMPAKFGMDTGARSALLLYEPYVTSRGLREKYKPQFAGVTGWGIGGPVRSEIARIESVGLGGIEIRDVVARFSLNKGGATTGNAKAGLIGPDILKQFTLICDYARKRLILEKNGNFGIRDTYDKAGAWLIQSGDTFEVLDVIAGGPAEKAGLHVGDKVIAVDGRNAGGIVLPELRDKWKYGAAGTKVTLRVQSATGLKDVVLVLTEMV